MLHYMYYSNYIILEYVMNMIYNAMLDYIILYDVISC